MTKLLQDINLGENLRVLRKARGLTQMDVCAQLAQHGRPMLQSTYAQIETGTRNIFVSDLIALKSVFHCQYEDFFRGLSPISKYEDLAE